MLWRALARSACTDGALFIGGVRYPKSSARVFSGGVLVFLGGDLLIPWDFRSANLSILLFCKNWDLPYRLFDCWNIILNYLSSACADHFHLKRPILRFERCSSNCHFIFLRTDRRMDARADGRPNLLVQMVPYSLDAFEICKDLANTFSSNNLYSSACAITLEPRQFGCPWWAPYLRVKSWNPFFITDTILCCYVNAFSVFKLI